MNAAFAYFGLDDLDKGFAVMMRAVDEHSSALITFGAPIASPIMKPYRGDPRLQRVIDRMGLTEYARAAWAGKH